MCAHLGLVGGWRDLLVHFQQLEGNLRLLLRRRTGVLFFEGLEGRREAGELVVQLLGNACAPVRSNFRVGACSWE